MPEPGDPSTPEGPFDGLQWRAVAFGVVVDHAATLIYSTMLMAITVSEDFFSKDAAVAQAARDALAASPGFLVSILLGGTICTVLAAFVGARWAGEHYVRHGVWIAIVSAASVMLLGAGVAGEASWYDALGALLILPAGWLGGTLARWAVQQQLAEEAD